jgi:hypothetical protein
MPGDHSNDRLSFLTILDNVLTVGESTGAKEGAGQPQPQSGGLLEGAGWGTKNGGLSRCAPAVVRALLKI